MHFSTQNREEFILEIHKIFQIDISIIDCALKLKYLEYFFENKNFNFYHSYDQSYNIPFNTQIKTNYKHSIYYAFISFFVYKNLSFICIEDLNNIIYNKNIIYTDLYKNNSVPSFLYISNHFFLKNCVNHNLNLLSPDEKIKLQTFVEEFFYNNNFFDDLFNNKKYFTIEYQINFNPNDSIEDKFNTLEYYITDANNKYKNILKELKQSTDVFFERALLEKEINLF